MRPKKSTDYVERAVEKLPTQFRFSESEALTSAVAAEVQELEDFFAEIRDKTTLESAEGAQLDQIGRVVILGRGAYDRNATDDLDYRAAIVVRIRALRSNGKTKDFDDLLTLLTDLTGGSWDLEELPPAAFAIYLFGVTGYDPGLVTGVIAFAKPAGVALEIHANAGAEDEYFRWASGTDEENSTTDGWDQGLWTTLLYAV